MYYPPIVELQLRAKEIASAGQVSHIAGCAEWVVRAAKTGRV